MPDSPKVTPVSLTINGRTVRVPAGTTLLQAARSAGIDIPTLCYHPNLTANAVCRLCVVEVVGARNLQPACVVPVAKDMVVNTETDRVQHGPARDPGAAGLHGRSERGARGAGLHRTLRRPGRAV